MESNQVQLRAASSALEISHDALLRAVKAGSVPRNDDGSFDIEKCRAALQRNSDAGAAPFLWPESMERGLFEWKDSMLGLKLLRHLHREEKALRPTNFQVAWFLNLAEALPDNDVDGLWELAKGFAAEPLDYREPGAPRHEFRFSVESNLIQSPLPSRQEH